MSKIGRKHDRLAVRLSLIITRLMSGETLHVHQLVEEFNVSIRTLRRDFRERLIYLDLEYQHNSYRLAPRTLIARSERDILTFVRQIGMTHVFPCIDSRLINKLLSNQYDSPCVIWHHSQASSSNLSDCFYHLICAITEKRKIILLTDALCYQGASPYRLIYLEGIWYLITEYCHQIQVIAIGEIREVILMDDVFISHQTLYQIISHASFISALPHFRIIHQAILTVSSPSLATRGDDISIKKHGV